MLFTKPRALFLGLFATSIFLSPMSYAVADATNQGRWTKPTENDLPDRAVPGFLVNLGPTGARAVLTEKTFIVRYIFASSPAVGQLMLEDVITGVFGTPFSSHRYGGIFDGVRGYEGPIMDFGNAIERAEGSDGQLVLNVLRGTTAINITISLDPIGSFSSTFPINCPKSTALRAKALAYFAASADSRNVGKSHARAAVTLALLTSDDVAQKNLGKAMAQKWSLENPNAGTWTWNLSHQLITLCEYYRLTNDAALLPKMKTLVEYLEKAQLSGHIVVWNPAGGADAAQQLYSGGFGHAPYVPGYDPNGGYGPNGYGPMQNTTILALTAWQCAARCGIRLKPDHVQRALNFIHCGTNAAGYVAYGGEFTMNNGPVDAVAWKKSTGGDNYVGRTGAAMLAHKMSPEFSDTAAYILLYKSYTKSAYKSLPDGHADSNLGLFWGLLGAGASGDNVAMRTVFDYHKAFINMMRCHDGSFVLLPGRDYADHGYYNASRYHPTATMALVLGLSAPKLFIQGVTAPVTAVNQAPVLAASIPDQSWVGSGAKTFSFVSGTFTDADGDALSYRATMDGAALPSSIRIDSATRTISGTPTIAVDGVHIVVVTADDSYGGTTTDTFNLTISNNAPVRALTIPDQSWDGSGTKTLSFVSGTFSDADGDALSYSATMDGAALPSWLGIDSATRTMSGNPPTEADGKRVIVMTASDSYGGTATDTFDLTITNANDPSADKKCGLGSIAAFSGLFLLLGLMQLLVRRNQSSRAE